MKAKNILASLMILAVMFLLNTDAWCATTTAIGDLSITPPSGTISLPAGKSGTFNVSFKGMGINNIQVSGSGLSASASNVAWKSYPNTCTATVAVAAPGNFTGGTVTFALLNNSRGVIASRAIPVAVVIPTTTAAATTIEHAEDAIKWAKARLGSSQYKGMCLQFVANAYNPYGVNMCIGSCLTAKQLASSRTRYNTGNPSVIPPRGALVFFDYINPNNKVNQGHIGISLGDGTFISALSTIQISKLNGYDNKNYLGWCYPSNKYK